MWQIRFSRSRRARLTCAVAVGALAALLPTGIGRAVATNSTGYQWADFDGDGAGDLAIGAPGEAIGTSTGAGAVNVLYGGTSGLRAVSAQLWHQDSTGLVGGTAETGDHFGAALAVGDFNNDSFDDLAIAAPDEDTGSARDGGVVFVLYGSTSGLRTLGQQIVRQGAGGIEGTTESGDRFGAALAAGDFDGDGASDLAAGVPGEDLPGGTDAGAVALLFGDASGLSGANAGTLTQATPGFDGDVETGDRFGFALTSGDFDASGEDDLAIGSPYDSVQTRAAEGLVHVIRGGAKGLDRAKTDLLDQDTIFRTREGFPQEHFGYALATGDFDPAATDPAHYDDLAIGVPGDLPGNSGAVDVVLGSDEGFVARAEEWFQGRSGERSAVEGSRESNDGFGAAIAVNDFDGNGAADLAVGVRGEDVGTRPDVGGVNVIYSNGDTLDPGTGPNQFWTQDSSGVAGNSESGDGFGSALSSGNFDDASGADLAVGAPGEDVGTSRDAGVVHVIYDASGAAGLRAGNSDFWSQNSGGVAGRSETNDQFGGALG
jgi:hypothetical protein